MVLHSRGQMHMQCTIFRCIEAKGVYEFFCVVGYGQVV